MTFFIAELHLRCPKSRWFLERVRAHRPGPPMHKNLPSNGLLYAKLQVIPLYSHEHEGNRAVTELIGSQVNEIGTSLSMLLHLYRMDINTGHVHQLRIQ